MADTAGRLNSMLCCRELTYHVGGLRCRNLLVEALAAGRRTSAQENSV